MPSAEEYGLGLEQEQAQQTYFEGMEMMRDLLTESIDGFMAKRETEMKGHRVARQLVVEEVRTVIQGLWASARVELYGSCFTGLDLVSSDVDIVVCGLPLWGAGSVGAASPAAALTTPQQPTRPHQQQSLERKHSDSNVSSSSSPEGTVCSVATTTSGGTHRSVGPAEPSSAGSSVMGEDEESSHASDVSSSTLRTPAGAQSPALSSPTSSPRLGPTTPATSLATSATPPRPLPPGHGESVRCLHQLAASLEGRPWVRSLKTIDTAYVPVIKILADPCALLGKEEAAAKGLSAAIVVPVDISLEGPQHGGIASSLLIRDMVGPGGPYAHAVPLTLVLKSLMTQRGLNQPWCGGVSSYALMLMVIAVLQQFETPEVAQANVLALARSVDTIKRRMLPPPTSTPPPHHHDARQQQQHQLAASSSSSSPASMDYGKALRGGSSSTSVGPSSRPPVEVKPPPPLSTGGYGSPAEVSYRLWSQFAAAQTGGQEGKGGGVDGPGGHEHDGLTSGFLLTYFLEYFGRVFNPRVEGISVDQGYGLTFPLTGYYMSLGLPVVSDPITILDPLDRSVNVARCAFRVGEIQFIFGQCLSLLETRGVEMARAHREASAIHPAPAQAGAWEDGGGVGGKKKKKKGNAAKEEVDPLPAPVPAPAPNVLGLILL